ncbi:DNA-3-methyladenine glycosylase isoform X1 [Meriones unguiculatus]|uniref:DNA-3-methyladenine glycosylase isoform X1 n=1 Tax=Meriones unguiculatus TaxID=10047 RepID=UPI00293F0405|nr:DNA-3-methyladenine glycosylase isoform X1 [Meriones unguiculatus]XP_060219887.1 DNA-3-methyladenine glycosylase isoform X1 [Meriones unguiculatus]
MRARRGTGLSARLGRGAPKPVSVTLALDTDRPPFPGRARRPGNARAGSRVTGYPEAGQMPVPLSRKIGQKKQRLAESEQQQTPKESPPLSVGLQRSIYFSSPEDHPARLGPEFFDQPAVTLARAFLGQVLVRRLADGTELRGRIVETEAYLGPEDEAAHSRGGRQTARNRGMFMKPGTLYVYIIYGMYFCLNVSSQGAGACVLLRALEPLEGLETMRQLRNTLRKSTVGRSLKDRELCSGPSKLCQALAIDKTFDQRDLAQDEAVWLEHGSLEPSSTAVVAAARIGIGYAGEWTQKPLRFYVQGSPWVSVVDRVAEQMLSAQQTACPDGLNCLNVE